MLISSYYLNLELFTVSILVPSNYFLDPTTTFDFRTSAQQLFSDLVTVSNFHASTWLQ